MDNNNSVIIDSDTSTFRIDIVDGKNNVRSFNNLPKYTKHKNVVKVFKEDHTHDIKGEYSYSSDIYNGYELRYDVDDKLIGLEIYPYPGRVQLYYNNELIPDFPGELQDWILVHDIDSLVEHLDSIVSINLGISIYGLYDNENRKIIIY